MAVQMVKPGDVLMIDSGSTTAHFARALAYSVDGLTVITNCLAVAQALAPQKTTRVMFCPGEFSAHEGGVYGPETCAFLERFNADIAFIGASGLTLEGPNDVESDACWVKRRMLERAERRALLVTSNKFNRRHLELVCPLGNLSDIVTEALPAEPLVDALHASRVALHVSSGNHSEMSSASSAQARLDQS
jgi:DeoR/GlpR family transcriptional regulator of sugar metabolism